MSPHDPASKTPAGAAAVGRTNPAWRRERAAEYHALADWYAERGDAETAADYRALAQRMRDEVVA
jgi:hypothetical protein